MSWFSSKRECECGCSDCNYRLGNLRELVEEMRVRLWKLENPNPPMIAAEDLVVGRYYKIMDDDLHYYDAKVKKNSWVGNRQLPNGDMQEYEEIEIKFETCNEYIYLDRVISIEEMP